MDAYAEAGKLAEQVIQKEFGFYLHVLLLVSYMPVSNVYLPIANIVIINLFLGIVFYCSSIVEYSVRAL